MEQCNWNHINTDSVPAVRAHFLRYGALALAAARTLQFTAGRWFHDVLGDADVRRAGGMTVGCRPAFRDDRRIGSRRLYLRTYKETSIPSPSNTYIQSLHFRNSHPEYYFPSFSFRKVMFIIYKRLSVNI